jgi:excisionase family DNA binding protein
MSCEPAIDAQQAARILGIHHHTALQYAREGKIPAFRIGRVWRFRASALDEWMKQQLNSTPLPLAESKESIQ